MASDSGSSVSVSSVSGSSDSDVGTVRLGQRSIAGFRFHHMLRRFSRDLGLLDQLACVEIDRSAATDAMASIILGLGVAPPLLSFSRRRKHADGTPTGTGATLWSVDDLITIHGEAQVEEWNSAGLLRSHRRRERVIRLGDPTLLASAAHEAAHVAVVERAPGSPSHGKVFVAALDEAAQLASFWLLQRHPEIAQAGAEPIPG